MNDGDTVRARQRIDGTMERVLPDGSTRPLSGDSNWPRLLAMSDDEIEANAAADPDNPPLSPDELARMRPVSKPIGYAAAVQLTIHRMPNRSTKEPK